MIRRYDKTNMGLFEFRPHLLTKWRCHHHQITNVDPCHELVWNLDACNRTMSMDERRVANIRKFFDKVGRDDPVHG